MCAAFLAELVAVERADVVIAGSALGNPARVVFITANRNLKQLGAFPMAGQNAFVSSVSLSRDCGTGRQDDRKQGGTGAVLHGCRNSSFPDIVIGQQAKSQKQSNP